MRKFFVYRGVVFFTLVICVSLGYFVYFLLSDVSSEPEADIVSDPEIVLPEEKEASEEEMSDVGDAISQKELQFMQHDLPLDTLSLPEGFGIDVYASSVAGARSMTISSDGTLYVGTRSQGNVYAIYDRDQDGRADGMEIFASGLNSPNGVAIKDGDLYVAEINRILKYPNMEPTDDPEVVFDGYPTDASHGWKFIAFGPQGDLYVPVGAPCNVCTKTDPFHATITRLDVETGSVDVFAEGVRNTVGFDWHPETGELWFTDNGRDRMGDDIPPDELNRAPIDGYHFGFPFCHGDGIVDPTHGALMSSGCYVYESPVAELHPHGAALGMRFYQGDLFPDRYQGQIFLAEHGSWNRSTPIGYQVSFVELSDTTGSEYVYEAFVRGWLRADGSYWGRPVDVQELPDGRLLISDDYADVIYVVRWLGVE